MPHEIPDFFYLQGESVRELLYPLGFISSCAFAMRFLVQWYQSEKSKKSIAPPLFWKLSLAGNCSLMIHSFIQLHFPMYLLQSLHIILAWRNLNLMGKKPAHLLTVLITLPLSGIIATIFYYAQSSLIPSSSFFWIRSPHHIEVPQWLHLLGIVGIAAFSLRFWIQWIDAERKSQSTLGKPFWYISLFGASISAFYFFSMRDWVNIVGPLLGIVPYMRNIMLIQAQERCIDDKKDSSNPDQHGEKLPYRIALIAGEMSGDEIGSTIAAALKELRPDTELFGVCGPKMRAAGITPWFYVEKLQVMGFFEVLKKLGTLWRSSSTTLRAIRREMPDMVIFIDQPSFSSHLARKIRLNALSNRHTPPILVQVVAPSVWAYKPERAKKVKNDFDALFYLYRFEGRYFNHLMDSSWIGHPVVDKLSRESEDEINTLKKSAFPLVALFPGSRPQEIRQNLAFQLEIFRILNDTWEKKRLREPELHPLQGVIQLAGALSEKEIFSMKKLLKKSYASVCQNISFSSYHQRYELMKKASCALAKSGTVTLELALCATPHAVCYRLSRITYFWAKKIMKIDPNQSFALPNILSHEKIIPEYIGNSVSKEQIAQQLFSYVEHGTTSIPERVRQQLIEQILPPGSATPSEIAARRIFHLLDTEKNRREKCLKSR